MSKLVLTKPYAYSRFGPDNKLVVSFRRPAITADQAAQLDEEFGTHKSQTKPQKKHLIYKNGRYGIILWIDRNEEEVVFKMFEDNATDSLHLDMFSSHITKANKKGVTVTWILD